jgi:hypothetical protein
VHQSRKRFKTGKQNEMTEYRRAYVPGGSWFFTVNLAGKGEYGNINSGSIFYVTQMILTGMSIIFIGILLNMAGQKE